MMHAWRHAVVLWLSMATLAAGRDLFVNNLAGDDHFNGDSSVTRSNGEGPTRTIAKALRRASPGDRIVIANTEVPYRESISLTGERHSGGPAGPLAIEGNGATLDGSAPIRDEAWTHHAGDVFSFMPARLGYQQLFFGVAGPMALRHPIAQASPRPAPLEPLEWCLWSGRVYFRAKPGRLPQDDGLACCYLQTGITLYQVHDVVVSNLVVQGFHVDGLNANDGVRDAELRGITARANGRSGVSAGGSSRVALVGCTLVDNGAAQLRTEEYAHVHLTDSRLIDSTAPAHLREGGRITTGRYPDAP